MTNIALVPLEGLHELLMTTRQHSLGPPVVGGYPPQDLFLELGYAGDRHGQDSGQIGVKMYDKRGDSPPEPVIVNSSSGICSRSSVRNMQEPLSELCMGVREDSNVNRIACSVDGLSKISAYS
jgi:hypothetical protein